MAHMYIHHISITIHSSLLHIFHPSWQASCTQLIVFATISFIWHFSLVTDLLPEIFPQTWWICCFELVMTTESWRKVTLASPSQQNQSPESAVPWHFKVILSDVIYTPGSKHGGVIGTQESKVNGDVDITKSKLANWLTLPILKYAMPLAPLR
jgi:hypothetical protein